MNITREVAIIEVYLDDQARYAVVWERTPARVWASEIAKACVWIVGIVAVLVLMLLLAPESRADSVSVDTVASYLEANSSLPLAVGVGSELANNLLIAQTQAWGNVWQTGSLYQSELSVLRAIQLYIWPGGPASITDEASEPGVWIQSRIAIDTRLTATLDPPAIDFGSAAVPEPGTWVLMLLGIGAIGFVWREGGKGRMAAKITARLREHRAIRLV